jgi:hypothetical protein
MGGSTSSYAAAGIAFEFIGARKPPHPATECFHKVAIPSMEKKFLSVTKFEGPYPSSRSISHMHNLPTTYTKHLVDLYVHGRNVIKMTIKYRVSTKEL